MISVSVVVCLLMLWIGMLPLGVSAESALYQATDIRSSLKTQGRVAWESNNLMLDWSLAGIEFEAQCQGEVKITFDVKSITDTSEYGGVYFTFVVDGVAQARDVCHLSKTGTQAVTVAKDLPAGKHTFAIYRQTEHDAGKVGVRAIRLDGTLLSAPKQKDLYIEFIGDSITAAYGNLGNQATNGNYAGKPLYQDATQGYAYLTAKELNADFSSVCWSGIGCKYGYGNFSMQEVYPLVRYRYDKNTAYDFSARQPDVIVLALGGIFRGRIQNNGVGLMCGSLVALGARYLCHIASGYILFASYAEWFFTQDGFPAWGAQLVASLSPTMLGIVYSVVYNGMYMVPEIILTAIMSLVIARVPKVVTKVS